MRIIRSFVGIGMAIALASCAGGPRVVTETETVEVPVTVKVPCLTQEQSDLLMLQRPKDLAEEPKPNTLTGMVGALRAKIKEWEEVFWPTASEVIEECSELPEIQD